MVSYGSDGIFWGHGKPSYEHENSGPNSCWNWEVQKVLSRECNEVVNQYLKSPRAIEDEDRMIQCFVRAAAKTHNVCTRELSNYDANRLPWESVKACSKRQFGLAIRNLVQTSIAVGECRPIPYIYTNRIWHKFTHSLVPFLVPMNHIIQFILLLSGLVFSLGPLLEFDASEMTESIFRDILLNGRVAVIRGASSSWPLAHYSCEDFRRQPELREFEIERVYGENDGSYVGLCEESSCIDWENDKRPSLNPESDGPQFAPLYWEVRKHEAAKNFIHSLSPDWSFLSRQNKLWKKEAVELWFSPPSAGAKSHMDAHVQATVVTQLVGSRRWRLGLIPNNTVPALIPNHLDSNQFVWTPDIVTILHTGDILIFPPGSIHDTLNESPTSCAASITHQLGHPLPVKFFKKFLRNFLSTSDSRETWPIIADLASFGFVRPQLTTDPPFFAPSNDLITFYNESDPTNFFSHVYDLYVSNNTRGHFGSRPFSEYLAYHDSDDDKVISKDEFVSSAHSWLQLETSLLSSFPRKFRIARYFYNEIEDHPGSTVYLEELTALQLRQTAPITTHSHNVLKEEL